MSKLEALANRIENLETQNRWLKKAGVSALGVVIVALAMGQVRAKQQAPATQSVEAEESYWSTKTRSRVGPGVCSQTGPRG